MSGRFPHDSIGNRSGQIAVESRVFLPPVFGLVDQRGAGGVGLCLRLFFLDPQAFLRGFADFDRRLLGEDKFRRHARRDVVIMRFAKLGLFCVFARGVVRVRVRSVGFGGEWRFAFGHRREHL